MIKKSILYRLCGLIIPVILCGCSEKQTTVIEAPELIKPVATGESYLPVGFGNVEVPTVERAVVKCREYGQTFTTNQNIGSIVVGLGDEVKEGDIIAYSDTSELNKELEKLEKEIERNELLYALSSAIDEDAFANSLMFMTENIQKNLLIHQENMYYAALGYENSKKKNLEKLEQLKTQIKDNALYANHSGVVSYVHNTNAGVSVKSDTNVVVINDKNDKYLELNMTLEELDKLKSKTTRYIVLNGKEIPVQQIKYTGAELVLARLYGASPKVRFTFEGINELEPGDSVFMYFSNDQKKDVLVVYSSSIYGDDEKYVYVRNEDGSKEKRIITTGTTFYNYTEVSSGLKAGELVAYSSDDLIPSDENIYTVSVSDMTVNNHAYVYSYSGADKCKYYSELEGKIVDVSQKLISGTEVEKGEYLYSIDIGERQAKLLESLYKIDNAKQEYIKTCNEYDKQVAENNKAYLENEDIQYRTYLARENEILAFQRQQLDINYQVNMETLTDEYENIYKLNDGTGCVKVYAEHSGTIESVFVEMDEKIKVGDETHTISFIEGENIRVKMKDFPETVPKFCNTNSIAEIGERIEFMVGEESIWGTCIGYYGFNEKAKIPYFCTDTEKTKISFNEETTFSENGFYVKLDDSENVERVIDSSGNVINTCATFKYINMENIVILPGTNMVKDMKKPDAQPYVWLEKDGYVFKQYVVIDTTTYSDDSRVIILSGLNPGDKIVY